MDTDTLLLIGIGGAVILLTKNPISDTIKGTGEGITTAVTGTADSLNEITGGIASPFAFVDTLFDRLSQLVKDGKGGNTTQNFYNTIGEKDASGNLITAPISSKNPVSNATITGKAYGFDVHTITSSAGQKSNIIASPNTYYQNLGVGFNAKGQGYSSAFAGSNPKSTTTFSTSSSGKVTVNNPFQSGQYKK